MRVAQPTSSRFKMLAISPELLLQLLFDSRPHPVEVTGLPDECSVCGVMYDWSRRAFLFRLEHPSFDEVPLGAEIPTFAGVMMRSRDSSPDQDALASGHNPFYNDK